MVVALEGPSRYDFAHEVPPVSGSRASLTWRWFDEGFLQQLQRREANLRGAKGNAETGGGIWMELGDFLPYGFHTVPGSPISNDK